MTFWPLIALPIFVIIVTFFIGQAIVVIFKEPNYLVPGVVFNNVTAMPLLLLQAISYSGVLVPLLHADETVGDIVIRAKAYILLIGISHNIIRFAAGPIMLKGPIVSKQLSPAQISDENKLDDDNTPNQNKHVQFFNQEIDSSTATSSNTILDNNSHNNYPTVQTPASLFKSSFAESENPKKNNENANQNEPLLKSSVVGADYGGTSTDNTNVGTSTDLSSASINEDGTRSSSHTNKTSTKTINENEYLLNRARQLSRASIDFDETRALLSGYFSQLENENERFQNEENVTSGPSNNHHNHRRHSGNSNALFEDDYEDDNIIDGNNDDDGDGDKPPTGLAAILPSWVFKAIPKPPRNSLLSRAWRFIHQFLNPAVVAAVIAVIIGVIPSTHWFFFKYSVMATSFTPSISSLGELYPALQLFALGSKLTATPEIPTRKTTIFLITFVRFLIAPIISIGTVWLMITFAPKNIWPQDRLLNFVLMIVPVGPPAITLAAVAEIAGVTPSELTSISRMLLYMYSMAPLVAPTVAVALSIAYQIGN